MAKCPTVSTFVSVLSAIAALVSALYTQQAVSAANLDLQQSAVIAAVQSRVGSCAVLARHHYEITNQRALADVFANTSRALTLCLVPVDALGENNFAHVSKCIQEVNTSTKYTYNREDMAVTGGVAC